MLRSQPIIYVDDTPPVIGTITEVDFDSGKRNPAFSLGVTHSNAAGNAGIRETLTVSFGGSCNTFALDDSSPTLSSATPTGNTVENYKVIFERLSTGTYDDCTVLLTDDAGNVSIAKSIPDFKVRSSGGGLSSGVSLKAPSFENESQVRSTTSTTTTILFGHSSNAVLTLQKSLNNTSCKIATEGPGSLGHETKYFGQKTKDAIACIQRANNLSVTGELDNQTIDIINQNAPNLSAKKARVAVLKQIISILTLALSDPTHPRYDIVLSILGIRR